MEKAVEMVCDVSILCHKGGFHLTQWISNSRDVLQAISEKEHSKNVSELNLEWHLQLSPGLQRACTYLARDFISCELIVYDPLGYLAAVILPAKQILQELCRKNCGWDEEVREILNQQWISWLTELKELSRFQVSRCLKPLILILPHLLMPGYTIFLTPANLGMVQ